MSLSDLAGKRDFKRVGRVSFTPAPPQNIGFHPPGTEVLQLLPPDWTGGQGSQLQPQYQVSKQDFTKKKGKNTN